MNTKRVVLILIFALFVNCSAIATADRSIVITERGPVRGILTPCSPQVHWHSLRGPTCR